MYTDVMALDTGTAGASPSGLLLEVDFKWLMAGQGHGVDPERLLHDPAYANSCIELALSTDCRPLQHCAQQLHAVLAGLIKPRLTQRPTEGQVAHQSGAA